MRNMISGTRLQSKSLIRERKEEQCHIAPCGQVLLILSAVRSIGEEKEKSLWMLPRTVGDNHID